MKTSTVHNPVNFNPADYEILDYWDNQPPQAVWGMPAEIYRQERDWFEKSRRELWPDLNDHRCQHCGQSNVRYVVAAEHKPSGKVICFGDICCKRLGFAGFDQFQSARIRSLAAAKAETYKKGLERELFISARPELKAALDRIQARLDAKDEGLSSFAIDLLAKFNQWGNLSDKQIDWVLKLADEVRVDKIKEARKAQAARSNHVGSIGERKEFTATVVFTKDFETDFGISTLTIMEDAEGNVLKWFGAGFGEEKGATLKFKATVKKHDEREGVKQTCITRAKLIEVVSQPTQ